MIPVVFQFHKNLRLQSTCAPCALFTLHISIMCVELCPMSIHVRKENPILQSLIDVWFNNKISRDNNDVNCAENVNMVLRSKNKFNTIRYVVCGYKNSKCEFTQLLLSDAEKVSLHLAQFCIFWSRILNVFFFFTQHT